MHFGTRSAQHTFCLFRRRSGFAPSAKDRFRRQFSSSEAVSMHHENKHAPLYSRILQNQHMFSDHHRTLHERCSISQDHDCPEANSVSPARKVKVSLRPSSSLRARSHEWETAYSTAADGKEGSEKQSPAAGGRRPARSAAEKAAARACKTSGPRRWPIGFTAALLCAPAGSVLHSELDDQARKPV